MIDCPTFNLAGEFVQVQVLAQDQIAAQAGVAVQMFFPHRCVALVVSGDDEGTSMGFAR